jgi:hypothetical protein
MGFVKLALMWIGAGGVGAVRAPALKTGECGVGGT